MKNSSLDMLSELIRLIQDSTAVAIIAVTCFLLIAMWVSSFIKLVIKFILAPKFYTRVSSMSIFGFEFIKQNDKFVFVKRSPVPLINANLGFDYKKFGHIDNDKVNKADSTATIVISVISSVICFILAVILILIGKNTELNLFAGIVSLALGLIFQGISSLVITIIALHMVNTSLSGYTRSIVNKIRMGQPVETFNLLPIEKLPYTNAANAERIIYYSIYMIYLDVIDDEDMLEDTALKLCHLLRNTQFNVSYLGAYYGVIYYFSYRNIDTELAEEFYKLIKEYIEKDTDSNGYRVRAHYELTVNHNRDLAYELAQNAGAKINVFSMGTEREYEKKCIEKLFNRISEYDRTVNQGVYH